MTVTMMMTMNPRSMIQHPNAGPWPVEITGPMMRPCPLEIASSGSLASSTDKAEDVDAWDSAGFRICTRPHVTTLSEYIQSDTAASLHYHSSNGHEDRTACPTDQVAKLSHTSGLSRAGTPPLKWNETQQWLVNQSSGEGFDVKASEMQSRDYYSGASYYSSCRKDVHPGKRREHRTDDWEKDPSPHHWKSAGEWTKKMTSSDYKANNTSKGNNKKSKFEFTKAPSRLPEERSMDRYLSVNNVKEVNVKHGRNYGETSGVSRTRKPVSDSFNSPEASVHSVSMRDTGTEMTPIASQEPSRSGTPIRATTPTLQSPVSSCPPSPRHSCSRMPLNKDTHTTNAHSRHRRSILNIFPWTQTTRTTDNKHNITTSSVPLKNIGMRNGQQDVFESRALAWVNAEQSKYTARFQREEAKILARENREKAKVEAEIRRAEVKADKLRSRAHAKLMLKVARTRQKAEERRAAAEARRCKCASKTTHLAEHIRQTGRLPSSFSFFGFGFCR